MNIIWINCIQIPMNEYEYDSNAFEWIWIRNNSMNLNWIRIFSIRIDSLIETVKKSFFKIFYGKRIEVDDWPRFPDFYLYWENHFIFLNKDICKREIWIYLALFI